MNRSRLLLIDEHPASVRQLRAALACLNGSRPHLVRASTLTLGLTRLHASPFDAVLLNVTPHSDDGLAALASLHEAAPGLPVIVLVAGEDDPAKTAALQGGAHDYLVKGQIDADRLQRTLRLVSQRMGVERELASGAERFHRVFEDSPLGMALSEADGRLVQVNKAFAGMLGYEVDELVGLSFLDFTHPDDKARTVEFVRTLVAGGGSVMQAEKRYVHRSGRTVWVLLSVSLLRDAAGAPECFIGQVQDITDRKRAEEELRFTQVTMDHAADAIYWMDHAAKLVYVNQAACRMLGYTREALLGMTLFDLDPGITPPVWQNFWDAGQSGVSIVLETRHVASDGTEIPIEVTARHIASHDRAVMCSFVRDIRERRRAEAAQRESEERYRLLFSTLSSGFALHEILCDAEGKPCDYRFLAVNPAFEQAMGLSAEQLVGHTVRELLPAIEPFWIETYGRVALTGEAVQFEREEETLGRYFDVVAYSPKPGQFATISMDITARRMADAALRASERRFEAQYRHMPVPTYTWKFTGDDEFELVDFNEVARRNSPDELEGMLHATATEFFAENPEVLAMLRRSHAGQVSLEGEQRYRMRSSGEWRDFMIHTVALPSELVLVHTVDITESKRAEAALRESEQRFRIMADSTLVIMWVTDAQGGNLFVNRTYCEYFGVDAERVQGGGWQPLLHPEDSRDYVASFLRAVRGQTRFQGEMRIQRADGAWRWLESHAEPRFARDGAFLGHVGVCLDVTDRKRIEGELRMTTGQLQHLFDGLDQMFCSVDMRTRRVLQISPGAEKIYGLPAQAFIEDVTRAVRAAHPADRAAVDAGMRRLPRGETVALEFRILRPDGEVRWVEAHAKPTLAADGALLRLDAVISDITARKQGENVRQVLLRALEATSASDDLEEFLEEIRVSLGALMDTTNFFVALYDSQKQLYRFPCFADEHDAPPPAECPLPESLTDYVRQSGRPQLLDAAANNALRAQLGLRRSGTPSHSWLGVPLRTAERSIGVLVVQSYRPGALYTPRDLELLTLVSGHIALAIERKRAVDALLQSEAQLRQAQKMEAVGRLAGGVAHDFNNLLTTILGYSELALLTLPPASTLADGVTQIRRAAERAASLTRQLLAFSRKQVLQPKVFCLNDVVADMEKMLRRLIGEDVTLVTRLSGEAGMVKADPGQLEQVIMNLVVNARDAMESGGDVAIESGAVELTAAGGGAPDLPPGHYVELTVRDTGCGMDADTLARIFEPFFTTKEPGKGTGLGLSTVYGIIEQSGGYIRVDSQVGEGTAFRIYLPRVDAPADAPQAAPSATGDGKETILLVEDEAGVRKLTRDLLRGRGYTVLEAACGAEALKIAAEAPGRIDLMLTDMIMPGLSGRELAGEMMRRIPDLKLLFISGYTADYSLDCEWLDGGKAFLAKPFTANELYQKVRQILDDPGVVASSDRENAVPMESLLR